MARKDPEEQREYNREEMRAIREYRKWRHLCADCGKQDAYTMAGRYRCAECTEKKNAQERERTSAAAREKRAKRKTELLAYRRDNRLCTTCGDQLPPPPYSYATCPSCRAENRRRLEEKRRANGVIPVALYPLWSLCMICGQPRMEGNTAWGGEPIKLCQRCYENTLRAGEAGRAAYYGKYGETYGEAMEGRAKRLRDARKGGNMYKSYGFGLMLNLYSLAEVEEKHPERLREARIIYDAAKYIEALLAKMETCDLLNKEAPNINKSKICNALAALLNIGQAIQDGCIDQDNQESCAKALASIASEITASLGLDQDSIVKEAKQGRTKGWYGYESI